MSETIETRTSETSTGLVAGRLEGMSIPDLMWLLCRRRATGTLVLVRGPIEKRVYFQDGHIVFASSDDPNDRLGEMLLREGMITLEQLEDAIGGLYLGKRLGTILVESGHLKPEDLVRGVHTQVREIVLGLFTWEDGAYRFDEGSLPSPEVVTLGMKTGEILLIGIRRITSFSRIRRSVGGPRRRYRLVAGSEETAEGLPLIEAERLVVQRLRSGTASIDTLCEEIYASNFEIHQALWSLKVLGIAEETETTADVPSGAFLVEGRLLGGRFVDILVRLCRAGETGVLHVTRGLQERTFHIRDGRCVFATSNSIDDGLVAHLLRRGVISLRDREETARRLLSNKRVGTILLEMGVLDTGDLREMVREQLSEIVFDTFRMDDGDYVFVSGELPTIEEIVLESSLEDLVSEGLRRVTSWSRVREGCGFTGSGWIGLHPDYLAVLDRMRVGSDEWEVVSCLGVPKNLHEICRTTRLGDFRVCQILWALRLLGALREVTAEEALAVRPPEASELVGESPADPTPLPVTADAEPLEVLGGFDGADPAVAGADAVPPSEWNESSPGSPRVPRVAWLAEIESGAVPVADAADTPSELVSEPWRLTAEAFPRPLPLFDRQAAAGTEAPAEGPVAELPEGSTVANEEGVADRPPSGTEAKPEPSRDELGASSEAVPPVDSLAGVKLAMSPGEEAATHEADSPREPEPDFELAAPGSGTEGPSAPRDNGESESAKFELSEPIPEAPEPIEMPQDRPEAHEEHGLGTEDLSAIEGGATVPAEEVRDESVQEAAAEVAEVVPDPPVVPIVADRPRTTEQAVLDEAPDVHPARVAVAPVEPAPVESSELEHPAPTAAPVTAPVELPEPPHPAPAAAAAEPVSASLIDLDSAITRFNQRHRVLYRAIRSEIGAGTQNFILACKGGLDAELGGLFSSSRLLPDGTWDTESLKKAAKEKNVREPWLGLERLLDREFEMLRPQIGDARGKALREQLLEVGRAS